MPNSEHENNRLSRICAEQQDAYLRRSSIRFLECAIHLCVTHMSLEEVARLLEAEAKMLRDLG
ncbi:hypothetical protein KX729_25905 [Rhizobium sp. XQZ8]|uniref:hypothetical protein n=1 Tax=Rhizobium populisoli TaxID=2859785 RepID=UPI001CA50B9A|nr:hypothetical protein [Rhizobium populisoli]MBW6424886.1 hypothetical protein [Rhizobium populisoli]